MKEERKIEACQCIVQENNILELEKQISILQQNLEENRLKISELVSKADIITPIELQGNSSFIVVRGDKKKDYIKVVTQNICILFTLKWPPKIF